jgi:hypothetical protein
VTIILEILWAAMALLFIAGAISYAVQPQLGRDLLKRAIVLATVLLVEPSIVRSALDQIPAWILVILVAAASLAAYYHLTNTSGHKPKQVGASTRHAERQPRLPHHEEQE